MHNSFGPMRSSSSIWHYSSASNAQRLLDAHRTAFDVQRQAKLPLKIGFLPLLLQIAILDSPRVNLHNEMTNWTLFTFNMNYFNFSSQTHFSNVKVTFGFDFAFPLKLTFLNHLTN